MTTLARCTATLFLASATFALAGCADTTTSCQSGAKYGTQCYNSAGQTTYSSAPSTPQPPVTEPSTSSTKPQR